MEIEESWKAELEEEFKKPYMAELKGFLEKEYLDGKIVYPPKPQIFQAFFKTPFKEVKVVIVGQDPYHGAGQAHGLSFSIQESQKLPPSLKNIYKELKADLGIEMAKTGNLTAWAKQGVLLLNATLTVREGEPKSHFKRGWETFTDAVIDKLLERDEPIVFLLWGKSAQDKGAKISSFPRHQVFVAAHPSPYSVSGFYGCRHFSKTNSCLEKWGKKTICWDLLK